MCLMQENIYPIEGATSYLELKCVCKIQMDLSHQADVFSFDPMMAPKLVLVNRFPAPVCVCVCVCVDRRSNYLTLRAANVLSLCMALVVLSA